MIKQLARLDELRHPRFTGTMGEINQTARKGGLREYTTYSRVWEYPWLWLQLEPLKGQGLTLLDIGTELSPFPWFLAAQGFKVTVSDVTARHWPMWDKASRLLDVPVRKRVLDALALDLPTSSIDVYLSVSVIEHLPLKAQAILEAARVLRPGGLLVMTFDISEPDLAMSFPEWNGRALTMAEFDGLFRNSPWFEPGLDQLPWNTDSILAYLSWHQTTAPHHEYVTGAAVVRRNGRDWCEPVWNDPWRLLKGCLRTARCAAASSFRRNAGAIRQAALRPVKAAGERVAQQLATPRVARLLGEPLFWLMARRKTEGGLDLSRVRRVLVVRLDEIGDAVMTTPFLRALRRNLPDAWITLVVKPAVYNLVELCPYVNEVLIYDWKTAESLRELRRHGRALRLARQHLWHRRFDLAILPRWDADGYHGSFVTYFSGAPWRVGFSENVIEHKRRLNRDFDGLFTHVLEDHTLKHEVERNLDVLRFLGGSVQDDRLELWLGPEDEVSAEQCLQSHHVRPGDLVIAFGPGAGSPRRMWPLAHFLELGEWLSKEDRRRILVIGGKGEEPLGQALRRHLGETVINVVGQTTLRQAGALLKRCQLFVGNDAGPMHLAAAAGVPVVEISCHPQDGDPLHYNSPRRFGPWGVPHRILQPETALEPCFKACLAGQAHCIASVGVGQVKEVMLAALSGHRRAPVPAG